MSIEPGRTPREIADAWVRAGVQTSPLLLYEWFRWSGRARQIRAGSYEIGAGTTPIRLLDKMVRGDETLAAVRFNEGWTFRQIRAELARAESLKPSTGVAERRRGDGGARRRRRLAGRALSSRTPICTARGRATSRC